MERMNTQEFFDWQRAGEAEKAAYKSWRRADEALGRTLRKDVTPEAEGMERELKRDYDKAYAARKRAWDRLNASPD